MCGVAVVACDGPGRRIVLEPLRARPDAAPPEEDAGPELPDGAVTCVHDSDCDDGIDCTVDVCLRPGYCNSTTDNSRCSDNLVCNGVESCDPTQGCIAPPPPTCDDQDPCTIDSCDETLKDCVHAPRDFDHDGEADYHCPGGTDCDDFDASRNTQVKEVCGDGIDNDCDDMIDEVDCGQVAHDTCADPLDISGGGSFELSMVGAVGDYLTSCDQTGPSRDVVLSFQTTEPQDVKFQASGLHADGSQEVTSLAIQGACGDMSTEVQCVRGFPGDLRVRALPAGQYSLIVSSSYSAGTVLLSASFSAPTQAPSNILCEDAIDVSNGGHFEGDFVDVGDKITSSCTLPGQPDVFYKFTLAQEQDVEISAIGTELQPVAVSLHKSCSSDVPDLRCDQGMRVLTRLHQLAKGTYILVLEGPATREIGFTLDVAIMAATPPPHGDTCDDPLAIALGDTQRVALMELQSDVTSSCQSNGPDAVLSLHVPSAQDLEITVDGDAALVAAALQTECGVMRTEKQCRTGMPLTTRIHDVAAGDYFLVIDSPTAPSVTVRVDSLPLTQTVPVSGNDNCYSATDVPAQGGVFSGDTRQLLQDYSATCGGGAQSKDAAFRLALPARKHVVARVDAAYDSVLLRYGPPKAGAMLCSDAAPAACNDDDGSGNGAGLDEVLDAGTYFYIVDGYKDFSAGAYVFDVAVTDP
jgi:hypothetical protein